MTDILAYADRLSVGPGETIGFKVSLIGATAFEARTVRLVGPDLGRSEHLPATSELHVPSPMDGLHPGRRQNLRAGSYVAIDRCPELRGVVGVTLSAFIFPTLPSAARPQVILGDCQREAGISLAVDGGMLKLLLGGCDEPLDLGAVQRHRWHHVAVSIDASNGRVLARCEVLPGRGIACAPVVEAVLHADDVVLGDGSNFAIAARLEGAGEASCHFNGKIERPQVFDRALDLPEMAALAATGPLATANESAAADWDFSRDIGAETVSDVSGHGCHGHTVQYPTRGVIGAAWVEDALDWRQDPRRHGAIHFHETDMADAGWETTLDLRVPDDWTSGCYAARFSADGTVWHVPFFVKAQPENRKRVALLMPTTTYAAYANQRYRFTAPWHEATQGRLIVADPIDMAILRYPEIGRSTYDTHSDGSSVHYGTLRRPVVNFRPSGRPYKFAFDLLIVAWLEHEGIEFDPIVDEDLHREGQRALDGYDVVISCSHSEYWSSRMSDALIGYLRAGGRHMCLGGNPMFWTVDLHPEHEGFVEVRRMLPGVYGFYGAGDGRHAWSGEPAGMWSLLGRPPQLLVGVGATIQGNDVCAGYRRTPAAADRRVDFMFQGVDGDIIGDYGALTGGAAGWEIDRADRVQGTPWHALVVASSFDHSTNFESDIPEKAYLGALAVSPTAEPLRADMVFFETPNGGAAFSVGSIAYCGSLAWNNYDNNLATLTGNVLRRFLDAQPFEAPAP